jgi:TPR repeat protein
MQFTSLVRISVYLIALFAILNSEGICRAQTARPTHSAKASAAHASSAAADTPAITGPSKPLLDATGKPFRLAVQPSGYVLAQAKAGHTQAMVELASRMGPAGFAGTSVNRPEAMKWANKAAAMGDPYAAAWLALLAESQGDKTQSKFWLQKALPQLNRAAANHDGHAEYTLLMLPQPDFAPLDLPQYFDLLARAANDGEPGAMDQEADEYWSGNHIPKDATKAQILWQKMAESGDPEMETRAARTYLQTTHETEKGLALLRKAAEQGYATAQSQLGMAYLTGAFLTRVAVTQDIPEGFKWLQLAANQEDALAETKLGEMYISGAGVGQNTQAGVGWLKRAAAQNFNEALFNLAECYETGSGVENSPQTAARLYTQAAQEGFTPAIMSLAKLYRDRIHDYAQAAVWFEKGVPDPEAEEALADLYSAGLGVEKNPAKAYELYGTAGKAGRPRAAFNVGYALYNGIGVPQNKAAAAQWYLFAAQNGSALAMNNYAIMLADGEGVNRDEAAAISWYQKAIAAGNTGAQRNLDMLQQRMQAEQQAQQAQAAQQAAQQAQDQAEADAQAQVAQRQQRIEELQSDIDEQEQEAAQWEQSENKMDDSSTCSGAGADLCQTIGNLGAAKARENANKARNQADDDRRQIAELQGEPAPVFEKRDTSYAGALQGIQEEHPTQSIDQSLQQQQTEIAQTETAVQARRATQRQNSAVQQQRAQQATPEQDAPQLAQQAVLNRSSTGQNVAGQTAGATLPTSHTSAPLSVRFGTITGYQGNAHVVSTPPGIDCPSTCSFQFGENAAVMLFATADQNSAVKYLSCQMSSGTGMLQAGNQMSCSIPQWAFEGPQVVVDVDQYPGPGTNSSASNGRGTNGSGSGGNGNSSGSGGSGASGGNSGSYVAPITQSCVREFWDPKFYNWLSFENDCGQAISLTWIAKNPSDHFGGASNDNIAPGQSANTGWSQTEVAAKGNFTLFICPVGSVAVDPNTNQGISSPNATYSCKKQ